MNVDRCVCHGLTFAHLNALARERSLGFEALKDATGCSSGCGLCEPYVRLMLTTGRTSFPVLSSAEITRIMQEKRP